MGCAEMGSPRLWLLVSAGAVALREILVVWVRASAAGRSGVVSVSHDAGSWFEALYWLASASAVLAGFAAWRLRGR